MTWKINSQCDLKAVNDSGDFEGYASRFGEVDDGADVVVSGAFAKALRETPLNRIKLLFQHDSHLIVGKWTELKEDADGLFGRGKILHKITEKAKETYGLMKEGVLDGLSIGFIPVQQSFRDDGVRLLEEVDLREISVVSFPMLRSARVDTIKSIWSKRELEQQLMELGLSARDSKALISGGYDELIARDADGSRWIKRDADSELLNIINDATHRMKGIAL